MSDHYHITPSFDKIGVYYVHCFNGRGEWTASGEHPNKDAAHKDVKRMRALDRKNAHKK